MPKIIPMSTDSSVNLDSLEALLRAVHSATPPVLANLLDSYLVEPATKLEHFQIFVLEVGYRLSHALVHDATIATTMASELTRVMKNYDLNVDSDSFIGCELPAELQRKFAYFLGRLQALIVLAQRLTILEIPDYIRQEVALGTPTRSILITLDSETPLNIKQLRQALLEQGTEPSHVSPDALHRLLTRLMKYELIASEIGVNQSIMYSISSVGKRLLND